MKASLTAAMALIMSTSAGWAGEPATPAPAPATQASAPTALAAASPHEDLSADMAATLRKAGFTDLQIMPDSVFVRGKDKAGNPVAMILNPRSMTEMVMLDSHTGTAAAGNGTPAPLTGSGTFVTILPTEKLASTLIGLPVVDTAGDKIGKIKDIAIDHGGLQAYIIGAGGIFGIGDRYVAVTPSAMSLTYDKAKKTYRAVVRATRKQLKAAPAFTFEEFREVKRD